MRDTADRVERKGSMLLVAFAVLALLLPRPAQANFNNYSGNLCTNCHSTSLTTGTNAGLAFYLAIGGAEVSAPYSYTVAAGSSFEMDWYDNNIMGTGDTSQAFIVELPAPTWAAASGAKGTVNNPTGTDFSANWNTNWDVAYGNGLGWQFLFNGSTLPDPNAAIIETLSGDPYSAGSTGTTCNDGDGASGGDKCDDLDLSLRLGADFMVSVPAGTTPGTYTINIYGIGHTDGNAKGNVMYPVTVTVTGGSDTTPPTFGGLTGVTDAGTSGTVNLTWAAATDPSTPITYDIYWSTTSGGENYTTPNQTSTNGTGATVTSLTDGTPYYFVVRAKDSVGNEGTNTTEFNATPTAPDTTIPVITLSGNNPQTIEVGSAYSELGATASDNYDGDISASIVINSAAVNTALLGSYSVTYDVADSSSNNAVQVIRTVNVVDTTIPVITLSGANPQTIEVGSAYSELGTTASDNYDGDISASIVINSAAVNTALLGSYSVTYDVADSSSNNAVQVTRTVNVVDTTIPVITLSGANPQTIEVGSAYSELGATASDNYDGDISASIVINSAAVNTALLGSYSVTYDVADSSSNNAVQVTRTVNVVDTTIPVITLTGANPQTINLGSPYSELGATASDNYDGDISGSIVVNSGAVDTATVGSYSVTYDVADSNGNNAVQVTRTVDVVAGCTRNAPVLTVSPDQSIAINGTAAYTLTVQNQDASCADTTFNLTILSETGVTTAFTASSLSSPQVTVAAGSSNSAMTLTVTGNGTGANGNTLTVNVELRDDVGHNSQQQVVAPITTLKTVNPMIHSSLSMGSNKWTASGGWGIVGGKYGEFTCTTCHTGSGTTNIKRIKTSIAFPDGSLMPNGATSSSVTLTDTRDTTSDYGDAAGNHAVSSGVCEVCHTFDTTQTNGVHHHAYNMSTGSASEQNHQLSADCMSCHNHKQGFKPTACDACHGNPPTTADTDGSTQTGLAWSPVTTGSTTPGAHDAHVNIQGFTNCNTCHNGNTMPNGGDIDIHFNADFSASGGGSSTTGTYGGQSGVNYNGGTAGDGTKACSNVYCHGGAIGGSNPVWDASVACGDCHGASAATPPTGGSHATHAGTLAMACTQCHGASAGGSGHMNGNVSWDVSALPTNTAGSAAYNGTTTGNTGALAPSAAYSNCSNIYCHFGTTPTWDGTLPNGCASCHNNGSGEPWPATGAHNAHFAALGVSLAAQVTNGAAVQAKCDYCHSGNTHADGTVQVNIALTYDDLSAGSPAYAGGTCSDVSCHGGKTTPAWSTGTIDANTQCSSCHKAEATGTEYNSATSGMHGITGAVSGETHGSSLACTDCHNGQPAGHFSDAGLATSAMNRPSTADFSSVNGTITLGLASDDDTCAMTCHKEGATNPRSGSTPWARLNNKTWASGGGAAGDKCKTCHGTWGNWRGNVLVDHAADWDGDTTPEVQANHSECETCHGFSPTKTNANYDATWGTGDHGNGLITMNGPSPSTGAGYNSTNWGCDNACHGNASTGHHLADSAWTVGYGDFGAGSCDICHGPGGSGPTVVWPSGNSGFTGELYGSHLKAATADTIDGTTDWTVQCQKCHPFHSGGVLIPNNATVGINYTSHGGLHLGGTATGGKITEAEICWTCHDTNGVSEWGTNTNPATGNEVYNYGSLSTSNWITATWTSANFSYKTGAIQSTHTANSSVTDANLSSNGNGGMTETPNSAAEIRCSYCHDVHNRNQATGDTMTGKPYLRGNWMGNPYKEDGAPQSGTTYTSFNSWGAVPRAQNNPAQKMGGYWIDQNSGNPTNGWTLASSAGLCTLCHGTDVDNMDKKNDGNLWVGTNGHSNAVLGGTRSNQANIFSLLIRNPSGAPLYSGDGEFHGQPMMAYQNTNGNRGYGLRSQDSSGYQMSPQVTAARPYAYQDYSWGASVDDNTIDPQFHKFSCSKCHNPHASRLPKLMITNCLDTKHNSWDDTHTTPADGTLANENQSVPLSNATSAQNCHRLADPAYGNTTGDGWNKVTPW